LFYAETSKALAFASESIKQKVFCNAEYFCIVTLGGIRDHERSE